MSRTDAEEARHPLAGRRRAVVSDGALEAGDPGKRQPRRLGDGSGHGQRVVARADAAAPIGMAHLEQQPGRARPCRAARPLPQPRARTPATESTYQRMSRSGSSSSRPATQASPRAVGDLVGDQHPPDPEPQQHRDLVRQGSGQSPRAGRQLPCHELRGHVRLRVRRDARRRAPHRSSRIVARLRVRADSRSTATGVPVSPASMFQPCWARSARAIGTGRAACPCRASRGRPRNVADVRGDLTAVHRPAPLGVGQTARGREHNRAHRRERTGRESNRRSAPTRHHSPLGPTARVSASAASSPPPGRSAAPRRHRRSTASARRPGRLSRTLLLC